MLKSEIINIVMRHPGVISAEVVDGDDAIVTINVLVAGVVGYSNDELYDLKTNIVADLEPGRPVGVAYDIVIRRQGELGPLSRFSAVAAEITAVIPPLKKPSQPMVEKVIARQLFAEVIKIDPLGVPSPCPRCACQAFTPDEGRRQLACRGCPLPSPMFEIDVPEGVYPKAKEYRCGSCGVKSMVTMTISSINLYCWGCRKLTLFDIVEKVTPPTKDPGKNPWAGSRVLKGTKAVFTFQGAKIEEVEYTESAFNPDAEKPDGNDLVDEFGYSMSFTTKVEEKKNWVDTITALTERVSAASGMTVEQLARKYVAERDAMSAPAAQLAEMFRVKLGLMPFDEYEQMQRDENIVREKLDLPADGRFRDRRTGRTTRGLIQAIARFAVSDRQWLCVVAPTESWARDLRRSAEDMVRQINLARRVNIKPIFPNDFDPNYDYERKASAIVFVDHSWNERKERRR